MSEWPIRTENLSRDFGAKRALDAINMKVPAGRVLALLGPNGAGKSTFLHLVTGLLEPTEGRSLVFDQNVRDRGINIWGRVASLGEGQEPPRWATLRRMINLQAEASPNFDRTCAEWLCEQQGLPLGRAYGTLSKGQKRWTLASLVLASGADLLLLDEPADGLDPSARRKLYDHLREYVTQREATAVVTTHVIGDIERVADDVAIICNGRLALYASLEDIREQVREVELPDTRAMPEFGAGVRLLGRRLAGTSMLAWVICEEDLQPELERMANGRATVRTSTLESVYLALTEHHPEYVDTRKVEVLR